LLTNAIEAWRSEITSPDGRWSSLSRILNHCPDPRNTGLSAIRRGSRES
jgi:hypothetical protein